MTEDERPSIAKLQRKSKLALDVNSGDDDWFSSRISIVESAPVLLEVVAAALAWRETMHRPRGDRQADTNELDLLAALNKVRP